MVIAGIFASTSSIGLIFKSEVQAKTSGHSVDKKNSCYLTQINC